MGSLHQGLGLFFFPWWICKFKRKDLLAIFPCFAITQANILCHSEKTPNGCFTDSDALLNLWIISSLVTLRFQDERVIFGKVSLGAYSGDTCFFLQKGELGHQPYQICIFPFKFLMRRSNFYVLPNAYIGNFHVPNPSQQADSVGLMVLQGVSETTVALLGDISDQIIWSSRIALSLVWWMSALAILPNMHPFFSLGPYGQVSCGLETSLI